MTRKLLITMELEIDHLPADEIDDIEQFADDEDINLEAAAASVLADASDDEVASCIQQAAFDPELFAGSMLYLKVVNADVVKAEWLEPESAPPALPVTNGEYKSPADIPTIGEK